MPASGRRPALSQYVPLVSVVDDPLQRLAGLELRLFRSRDLNALARPRVPPHRSRPIRNTEGSETDETNLTTTGESTCDRLENAVHGLARIGFAQTRGACHTRNELVFVHSYAPFKEVITSKYCDARIAAASLCLRRRRRQWPGAEFCDFLPIPRRQSETTSAAVGPPTGWFFIGRIQWVKTSPSSTSAGFAVSCSTVPSSGHSIGCG